MFATARRVAPDALEHPHDILMNVNSGAGKGSRRTTRPFTSWMRAQEHHGQYWNFSCALSPRIVMPEQAFDQRMSLLSILLARSGHHAQASTSGDIAQPQVFGHGESGQPRAFNPATGLNVLATTAGRSSSPRLRSPLGKRRSAQRGAPSSTASTQARHCAFEAPCVYTPKVMSRLSARCPTTSPMVSQGCPAWRARLWMP